MVNSNRTYDSYIEKTFYPENQSQIVKGFEPDIHWPCFLVKTNASQHLENEGSMGPHICQYRLYKIVSVVLYLCYAAISIFILRVIQREEMIMLVGMVEEGLSPIRRRLRCRTRRGQVAAAEALPNSRRMQDSNATLISGNITVNPSGFSSDPTLNGSDCDPLADTNDNQPPPPYPINDIAEDSVNLPVPSTDAPNLQTNTTENLPEHASVIVTNLQQNPIEELPPSYSSTIIAINKWRRP